MFPRGIYVTVPQETRYLYILDIHIRYIIILQGNTFFLMMRTLVFCIHDKNDIQAVIVFP